MKDADRIEWFYKAIGPPFGTEKGQVDVTPDAESGQTKKIHSKRLDRRLRYLVFVIESYLWVVQVTTGEENVERSGGSSHNITYTTLNV